MTSTPPTDAPPPPDDTGGTAEHAKRQAESVVATGKEQAGRVAEEVKSQTSQLLGDARSEARNRAEEQTGKFAGVLDQLSNELGAMADNSSSSDYLTAIARDGSSAAADLSRRLRDGGIDGALDDVRRFARRQPTTFLAAALGVGLVLGRVTRNADLGEIVSDDDPSSTNGTLSDSDRVRPSSMTSTRRPAATITSRPPHDRADDPLARVPGEPTLPPSGPTGSGGASS